MCKTKKTNYMICSKKICSFLLFLSAAIVISSCVKLDYDDPEEWERIAGTQYTIGQLRDMFEGTPVVFQGDEYVHALVTMDDKSGNIYRSAYIQDATGAVNLRLVSPGGIYRGDSIRIYLKGITLSSYQRMLQLDNTNVDRNIKKLDVLKEAVPREISIPAINAGDYQAHLVRINNVQFAVADTGKPFADSENLLNVNRMLEDQSGNRIIVRTSGYANFADKPVPGGSGSIVAIVSQFGSDMQLYIRSFDEVNLTQDRFPIPGEDYTLWSLANLRQNYHEGMPQIPANVRIEGVVISDNEHENHPGQNLYLMDESGAGMALRFSSFHDFPLGTKIRVIVSNMTIGVFNGLMQIENIPNGNAYEMGMGILPQPVQTNIASITSNMEQYESTLVSISNAGISGGSRFSDNLSISDGTGQMLLYTHSWASFAGNQPPSGSVRITGIVSRYNSPQLLIRNLNDIVSE
jgi:hypothetical protein